MDDDSLRRFRDSSVAAALNALTTSTDGDTPGHDELLPIMEGCADDDHALDAILADGPETHVFNACRELALLGIRPRSKAVVAFLKDRFGVSPSRDEVSPLVKKWRALQWKSDAVSRAFQAYAALDAEQRIAFRTRADVDDGMLSSAAMQDGDDLPFEIRIYYGGARTMVHRADRATTAWIKFQNLVDRRHPDAARIELLEHVRHGAKLLKAWMPTAHDITRWQ